MNNEIFTLNVVSIWAVGLYKRFMYVVLDNETYCVPIKDSLYRLLKRYGVPTLQSLRGKR